MSGDMDMDMDMDMEISPYVPSSYIIVPWPVSVVCIFSRFFAIFKWL